MLKKENFFITFTFIALLIIPLFFDIYYLNNISYFMLWTFISLGLALIWGMGGILSFGQTAFFGLAGYSFAIISINFADTFAVGIWSPLLALAITAIFGFYWHCHFSNHSRARNIYGANSWTRMVYWER
jgi:branched-chain amino acid transport system permease protein